MSDHEARIAALEAAKAEAEEREKRRSLRVSAAHQSASEVGSELLQFQAAVMTQFARAEAENAALRAKVDALSAETGTQTKQLTRIDKTPQWTAAATLIAAFLAELLKHLFSR